MVKSMSVTLEDVEMERQVDKERLFFFLLVDIKEMTIRLSYLDFEPPSSP